jgi:hypothetical protein
MNDDAVFAVFRSVAACGAKLWADGDSLKLQTTREVGPGLIARIKEGKAPLLSALARQAEATELMRDNPAVAAETREVCIDSPWGRVWIGPERTGQDRVEVTWQDLHDDPVGTLAGCRAIWDAVRVFEGRVVAGGLRRNPRDSRPTLV